MDNHLAKLLFKVLKVYEVQITQYTIKKNILTHPEFPSMQCISDTLDNWKIKNIVVSLSLEKLRVLDVPFIVPFKKGEYIFATKITDTKVHFWNGDGKEIKLSRVQFEKEWTGVALVIEDATDAGEPNYMVERRKEINENIIRYGFAGSFFVLLTVLTCFSWSNDSKLSIFTKILLFLVSVAGCFISYFLIQQEKRQSNKFVQKFCKAGTHIDCNKVTASRYSKLFGMISWAELGFAYFGAVVLWISIAPLSAGWLSPLWWVFMASLPFTVWSLFTQAFLIRKWCLFCCVIVLLLCINAGILYFWSSFFFTVPVVESTMLALLILVCTTTVLYVVKTGKSGDPYSEQRETARIKYDFRTIQSHLSESKFEMKNAGFVLGNSQARYEITLYVSIACSHCGTAVQEFRRLMEIYPNIDFRLVFAVNTDDFDHKANVITHHLISLYKTMDKNEFFDMLNAWYNTLNKKWEALQEAYPAPSGQDNKEDMNDLYQFSQQTKINYTPAILLNGRLLSQLYSYKDLLGIARTLNAEE